MSAVNSSITLRITAKRLVLRMSVFLILLIQFFLILVEKKVGKKWSRIRSHNNSDYLLKCFILEFKETTAYHKLYTLFKGCFCKCNGRFFVLCVCLAPYLFTVIKPPLFALKQKSVISNSTLNNFLWRIFVNKV